MARKGQFDLIIHSAEASLAGIYFCEESDEVITAQLIVLGKYDHVIF